MTSRKRILWTSVATAVVLAISVPSPDAMAQARGQGGAPELALRDKVVVAALAAAAEAARNNTPRQPARRT